MADNTASRTRCRCLEFDSPTSTQPNWRIQGRANPYFTKPSGQLRATFIVHILSYLQGK